jgi:hypothetical protein
VEAPLDASERQRFSHGEPEEVMHPILPAYFEILRRWSKDHRDDSVSRCMIHAAGRDSLCTRVGSLEAV